MERVGAPANPGASFQNQGGDSSESKRASRGQTRGSRAHNDNGQIHDLACEPHCNSGVSAVTVRLIPREWRIEPCWRFRVRRASPGFGCDASRQSCS